MKIVLDRNESVALTRYNRVADGTATEDGFWGIVTDKGIENIRFYKAGEEFDIQNVDYVLIDKQFFYTILKE